MMRPSAPPACTCAPEDPMLESNVTASKQRGHIRYWLLHVARSCNQFGRPIGYPTLLTTTLALTGYLLGILLGFARAQTEEDCCALPRLGPPARATM
eukprot:scaffold216_cov340-Prasinococcus_capsulatus_cf.AAC.4